jgi:hypothetical protein
MSVEILVRLQPSSVNLEGVGGGRPELTANELSCYLVGANDAEWWLAMTLYAGEDYTGKLARYLYNMAMTWGKDIKRKPSEVQMPVTSKMAYLAVIEFMDSGTCPICRGGQAAQIKGCSVCHGTGTIRRSDADKARYCHLVPERWKTWEPLFDRMMIRLGSMDSANKRRIYNTMLEDEKDIEI